MAEVLFNVNKINNAILKAVKSAPYDRIARTTVKRIKRVTRAGVSPVTGKRFKRLKASTIKTRTRLAKLNKTHKSFGESKSNLTFTGQLVNALVFAKFIRSSFTELNFFVNPTTRKKLRTGKKSRKGGKRSKPIDNARLGDIQAEGGRPFVGLDSKGFSMVTKIFKSHLLRELRKINK